MNQEESVYQRLLDQGYTEEQIRTILGLAGLEGDQTRLLDQMEIAKSLRNPQGPEGRNAGNVYVASNPLEHIGDVGNYYTGTKNMGSIYERQKQIQEDQMRRRMEYLKAGGVAKPTTAPSMSEWIS